MRFLSFCLVLWVAAVAFAEPSILTIGVLLYFLLTFPRRA